MPQMISSIKVSENTKGEVSGSYKGRKRKEFILKCFLLFRYQVSKKKSFKGVTFNSLVIEREPEPVGKVSCCHRVGYRLRLSLISCLQDAMEPVHFRVVHGFMALSVATSWGQALFFLHDA